MTDDLTARLEHIRPGLTELYKDLHANPELSFQEHRTAGEIARRLKALGLDVATGVGRTGVVGTLRNGDGPTVLLRADFDGLPVAEGTGLPYASTVKGTDPDGREVPVMHACGHDMHVTCLLGALDLLNAARAEWSGTVLAVFQPAEEIGAGARAMVEDGIFDRFGKPDVVLGQHVMPLPAGMLGVHAGPAFAATDAIDVRLFGKGGHGSMPEAAIDPVVMAASTVMRLQTVVSREIAGGDTAVVTVGSMRAGTKDNIIPDDAELKLNIRTFTEPVRKKVLNAVERIIKAEAVASGALREPEITPIGTFPLLFNDPDATARTAQALRARFGNETVVDPGAVPGSEDVGIFATAAGVPICYWLFGGTDPEKFAAAAKAGTVEREIPFNHSPQFAPVIEPTLTTGVTAMYTAARAWLGG
ncbi:amidohydrolase [Actinomadura barringtoniae]|uniref:Amidohydrolase n=1 Tax=Actinomadura barringtoniae TaxID=1427535 RepID=A0A939PKK9_9ACTN|nr:M20 family metallopeptidase [Actinomadura barringtoniae]MBO2454040.1 amidohydrolase [Actinomadura barringtoniae]